MAGENTKKVKILFLDDEERILNSLKAVFRFKYDVLTATSGAQALQLLKQQDIAVVVSDQRMPGMTGIDFLRQAKIDAPLTVRILLTGFSDLQAVIDSVNDGEVFRFLNKPWGNKEIENIIDEAVSVYLALKEGENACSDDMSPPVTARTTGLTSSGENEYRSVVLVKCASSALFKEIESAAPVEMKLLHVASQSQVLDTLQEIPVNVLVTMLDEVKGADEENTLDFLKLLKRELPALVTIGMVESADYDEIITLINEAKVYRYTVLPTRINRIVFFIESALQHAKQLQLNPELLRHESVMSPKTPLPQSYQQGEPVMQKLGVVRKLFGRLAGRA